MLATNKKTQGAHWHRAALQVNPFGYKGHPAPSDNFPSEEAYNTALLDACDEHAVSILAVTDHWKASTGAGLIETATQRGIVALPGFEANCREGFHLLVIFEAGTSLDLITEAIGACGAPENDPHGPGERSYSEIVEGMSRRGALVIPAHVNIATSGLFSREQGKPLQNIILNEQVLALGVTPSQAPMGEQEDVLSNRKPYQRSHPLVTIYADDVSHPDTISSEGGTSWFKMSSPSLRGLKHALRTPQTRVRLVKPDPLKGSRLKSIGWTGGFLDGLIIPIGPELTALIGGRGTGKSTIIESIRFALDQPPLGESARRDHDNMVRKVLGHGTIVRLEVERHEPTPARYVIQRTVGESVVVLDASGTRTKQLPIDVVGDLEVFGQHELAELAQDKSKLADLIRRLGGDFIAEAQRPALVERLSENRADLATVESKQEDLEAELSDIPRLAEVAEKFNETGLGKKLETQRLISSERATFTEANRRIEAARVRVEALDAESLVAEIAAPLTEAANGARRAHLESTRNALDKLRGVIESSLSAIEIATTSATQEVAQSREGWERLIAPELEEHATTVRSLVEQGYDPDAYLKTTSKLQELELRTEERSALQERQTNLLADRSSLLEQLAELDKVIASDLSEAITATNAITSKSVNVRPTPNPDRATIKAIIDRTFKTPRTQIMSAIQNENFSVTDFVSAVRSGSEELEEYGIRGAQAANLINHGESLLRELEEQSVGVAVDIYLNIAADGVEYRKLDDLSKGQRATALLLLLLSVSRTPLIIDQPEDDLDNRFVYHGIVRHLRELKGSRQLLVSTHNANVPVLGDAELIVVLESDGHRGSSPEGGVGSLDESSIRFFAERLLEGGEEAFRARRHLYGF